MPKVKRIKIDKRGQDALGRLKAFKSFDGTDWSVQANVDRLQKEIRAYRESDDYGAEIPLILAGNEITSGPRLHSLNPNDYTERTGSVPLIVPGSAYLNEVISEISEAQKRWRNVGLEGRLEVMREFAKQLKKQQLRFTAIGVVDGGKSFAEAEGDVIEERELLQWHIDLAEYLTFEPRAGTHQSHDYIGTELAPIGIFLTVGPCNFPRAIEETQNTASSMVGNAVIASPSDKAFVQPYLGQRMLAQIMRDKGIEPAGIINYMPGGVEMVRALAACEGVSALRLTGSTTAYYELQDLFGHLDRVSGSRIIHGGETGGNNGVYIHKDADPDLLPGLAMALCGNGGQKCSTPSYITVHKDIYKRFIERFTAELEKIKYGLVEKGADMGGLLSPAFVEKLHRQIAQYKLFAGADDLYTKPIEEIPNANNFAPTLLLMPDNATEAQIHYARNEEPFGPLALVAKVDGIEEAERHIKHSKARLTTTLYTQDTDLAQWWIANDRFGAGIAYVNIKCTGAPVELGFGGRGASRQGSANIVGSMRSLDAYYEQGPFAGLGTLSGLSPRAKYRLVTGWLKDGQIAAQKVKQN